MTKIYQTDKEGRQSNISQAEVCDHSYSDGGEGTLLRHCLVESGKANTIFVHQCLFSLHC